MVLRWLSGWFTETLNVKFYVYAHLRIGKSGFELHLHYNIDFSCCLEDI